MKPDAPSRASQEASLISLRCGDLGLQIAPEIGGSIASFYSMQNGSKHHWLRPAGEQALKNKEPQGMASFPMLPFCNRLRDGRANFAGRQIAVPPHPGTAPHALHGLAWLRAWSVIQCDASSAILSLDVSGAPGDQGGWPYAFSARQHLQLGHDGLSVTMEVENRDQVAMPLGLGHHPYFPRRHNARLTLSATGMWLSDREIMPTGLDQPALLESLRQGMLVDDAALDNNFIGWTHTARIEWPASDGQQARSVSLQASSPLDYVVLYTPAGQDYFCVEPASNCTDWLNLRGYSQADTGGAVLDPGETYRASFSIKVS